jgi:hypothetical protein
VVAVGEPLDRGVVVLERELRPEDDGVVMVRPASAGLFDVHAALLDGHGAPLLGSGELPSRLQVIDGRPTFAVDVDLVLARPSAAPVLWALRETGCELLYFDLAERDRTLELHAELARLSAPPAAVLIHSKDTAEVRTLGVDFRAVFLTATLRRPSGPGSTASRSSTRRGGPRWSTSRAQGGALPRASRRGSIA